jgi:hypothetical protein
VSKLDYFLSQYEEEQIQGVEEFDQLIVKKSQSGKFLQELKKTLLKAKEEGDDYEKIMKDGILHDIRYVQS